MRIFFIAFFIFHLASASALFAQDNFESFDREKWQELTRNIDYSSGEGDEAGEGRNGASKGFERGRPQDDSGGNVNSSGGGTIFPFGGTVFQVIMIVVFIAVLVIIINKLLGSNIRLKNKKKASGNAEDTIDNLEENLMESDLMRWLRQAVQDKNYRLALRIYYLMIIKELANNGLIDWQKEKTNLDYLYEMRNHGGHHQFEELTGIYQLVWYGEKDLGDSYLIEASHKFKSYFQSINASANG